MITVIGCGNEPPASPYHGHASAPLPVHRSVEVAPAISAPDPLIQPDPLAQGAGDKPINTLADPSGGSADALGDDPLASATGPKMPTDHSHWLRGSIFGARVDVRLNGVLLGAYSAPIDKDITMKLHAGVNMVTFSYTPLKPTASARINLLESEHSPPIPPLATFRSLPGAPAASPIGQTKTTSQTFTFIAR